MFLKYDNIVDRIILKNRLIRWKVLAFVFFLSLIVVLMLSLSDASSWHEFFHKKDIIGRFTIEDVITQDYLRDDTLDRIKNDARIKALVVRINSPGGSAGASEALYRKLLEVGREKPVVTVLGTVAASGGYMVALAGEHIVANSTTLTGSIGVVLHFFNVSELAKKVGVKSIEVKTSEYKAAPSPFSEFSEAARKSWEDVIGDTYGYFASIVSVRRHLSPESVIRIADGRVYTGAQALSLGLVDAIGMESEAIQWIKDNHDIAADHIIKDIKVRKSGSISWPSVGKDLAGMILGMFGMQVNMSDREVVIPMLM